MSIVNGLAFKPRPANYTMNDSTILHGLRKITPTDFLSPQGESEIELSAMSWNRHVWTLRQPRGRGEGGEGRGDTTKAREVERLRREVGDLRGLVDRQEGDIIRLEEESEYLIGKCKRRDDRIAELEHEIVKMRGSWQKAAEAQAQQAREMEERLKQTEGLLRARSTELSRAQTFLSTADRLSEMEVLDIVRDLNENIYQATVSLTEEWEKLGSSQTTARTGVDPNSRTHVPVLVQLARNRDLTGLTLLLQSNLCSQALHMTSSWRHRKELKIINDTYQRLSASGERQAMDTKW